MKERIAEMIELKNSGKSYSQIAEVMGVRKQRVQRLLMDKSKRQELLASSDGTCDKCGQHSDKLDAHHEDYNDGPVMLLCPSCHITLHRGKGGRTVNVPSGRILPATLERIHEDMKKRGMSWADLVEEQWGDNSQGDDGMAKYTIGQVIEKKYAGRDFGATALPANIDRVTIKSVAPSGRFAKMTGTVYNVRRETIKNGDVVYSADEEMREDSIDALNA